MASYEKRANGLWSVRFRETINGKERNSRLSGFKTKREAERALAKHLTLHGKMVNSPLLFRDLYANYLKFVYSRCKESSYVTAKYRADLHILPYFGKCKVASITPTQIIQWQNSMTDISFVYKKSLSSLLKAILLYGARFHDLPNPMDKVTPLKNLEVKKEMKFWTTEQYLKFEEGCDNYRIRIFFKLLFFTGMRCGECHALLVSDIKDGYISVSKTYSRKTIDAVYLITSPKTPSSVRRIPIPSELADEVKDYIKTYKLKNTDYLFFGKKPLSTNTFLRGLNKYTAKANLPKIRIHDFRHSFASNMLNSGLSIVALAKVLGHSDTQQLLNRYAHMMPNDDDKVRNAMSSLGTRLGTSKCQ